MESTQSIFIFAPGVLAGAERVVLTGVNALWKIGVPVSIIVIKERRQPHLAQDFIALLNPEIPVHSIECKKAFDLSLKSKIKNLLKQYPTSAIIHTHGFKALFYSYLVFSKNKIVHTHHGNTAHTLTVRIYEKISYHIMKKCSAVIAVSLKMKNELLADLSPYKNIYVIENMLSLTNAGEIYQKRKIEHLQKNSQLNKVQKIELIYIGRISPEKGLHTFLTYFKSFSNHQLFHLTVLGDGPNFLSCQEYVNQHKLNNEITFHGFVSEQSRFLINSDVLILPSYKEGLPMTLIEATSVGLTVIANNVGAISTLLIDHHNGILIEDYTEMNWHKALTELLVNQNSWRENAMNEAMAIEKKYSAESWARGTLALYASLK